MIQTASLIPQWTQKVVTEASGRDPFGLSRVFGIITDFLMTGIIITTDRARYYSFYCRALWHIENNEHFTKLQGFIISFRRREAVIALATVAHDAQTSPVGVLKAK